MPAWTWQWHPHPETWVLAAMLLGGYHLALRRIGPQRVRSGEPVATRGQRWSFTLGVLALLAAIEYPIHELAEGYLYSAHMVQHLIMSLAVPPLILGGMPAWMVRAILPPPAMRLARRITRPFIALVIFNATIVFIHWPLLVNTSVTNEPVHFLMHAVLLTASFIMWMPVKSPVLELPRLSLPGQMFYLFLQSVVPTVPASFLTFGTRPLYRVYETFQQPWGISALGDQQAAGLIMKLVGGFVLWGFIGVIFFRWAKIERGEGVDMLQMHAVERDVTKGLDEMEMVDR
ncbi:MAG TPA: cytochrome c oxidase assembly protein [Actinomycetota bacterium]